MLIRFTIKNVFSFFEEKEFNMLPRPKIRTPEGHKYKAGGVEVLKLATVYGANAAGKSNLVKALGLLKQVATGEISSYRVLSARFKFDQSTPAVQELSVECVQDGVAYYYGISIKDGVIESETLYKSGIGKKPDSLVFERKTGADGKPSLTFSKVFERDSRSGLFKSIILEDFVKKDRAILPTLANRENKFLSDTKAMFDWFTETLVIVGSDLKNNEMMYGLHKLQTSVQQYAEIAKSFDFGISSIAFERQPFEKMVGKQDQNVLNFARDTIAKNPTSGLSMLNPDGKTVVVYEENGDLIGAQMKITQATADGSEAHFDFTELSDGTIRLLHFLPAFQQIVSEQKVYVIDELERSMHPSLAKALVTKFSADLDTKGQLIFTTHESHLLDLDIFRQDEVWFAEKDLDGSTNLYSLSDFKEHHTTDIRKGYLNGRYGGVPFLSNLQDLNWHGL